MRFTFSFLLLALIGLSPVQTSHAFGLDEKSMQKNMCGIHGMAALAEAYAARHARDMHEEFYVDNDHGSLADKLFLYANERFDQAVLDEGRYADLSKAVVKKCEQQRFIAIVYPHIQIDSERMQQAEQCYRDEVCTGEFAYEDDWPEDED